MSIVDSDLLCHTCTINQRLAKRKLLFINGSDTFVTGEKVIGATSYASGTIDTVSGVANGYLVLSDVIGSFLINESISSASSAATTSAVDTEYVNADKEKEYYWKAISGIQCKFVEGNYNYNPENQKHNYFGEASPKLLTVYLPPSAPISRYTYTLTSTDVGFEGTYGIVDVKTRYDESDIDHYEILITKEI
jgi:hypothetical protein